MPGFNESDLLKAMKTFFNDIPAEERAKLRHKNFVPENDNVVRGISPIVDNDPSCREIYDLGCSLNLCSDEALKLPLYEDTPFPPQEEF